MPPESPTMLVNVDVNDIDAAMNFYAQALGFRLRRKLFGGTVAEMAVGSSSLYLLQKPAGSSPVPGTAQRRDYRRHWTPVHLDFVVADLEAAVERTLRAGAIFEGKLQSFPWGRMATMSDPFGNGFCLVQWIGAGYDNVDDDQVRNRRSAGDDQAACGEGQCDASAQTKLRSSPIK